MFQVDCDALVEIFGGDVLELVALVMGGVVDEHGDRPELGANRGDCGAERVNVGEVGGRVVNLLALPPNARGDGLRFLLLDIDEADLRALGSEVLDNRFADAAAAAGDQHGAVLQARIDGAVFHVFPGG